MAQIDIYFLIICAISLDLLIGDPQLLIHPVEIIGFYIKNLTNFFIFHLKQKESLFLAGLFITISTLLFSYLSGKFIELLYLNSEGNIFFGIIFVISLSSCLATKNLISSIKEIISLIKEEDNFSNLKPILIKKVQRLVSRDVSSSSFEDLLRSTTESLTENSVDGIFGPMFWILIGGLLIKLSPNLPGPLSLGFSYKALSTLDSMIGYKYDSLRYLGFVSAKLEDFATYIPCRIVAITLPFVSNKYLQFLDLIRYSFYDGKKYSSPNSGISEAIFAYIVNIQLGGENIYQGEKEFKPIINACGNKCNIKSMGRICLLIMRLKIVWIFIFTLIYFVN